MATTIVPIHPPLTRAQELATVVSHCAYSDRSGAGSGSGGRWEAPLSADGSRFMAKAKELLGNKPDFPGLLMHVVDSLPAAFSSESPSSDIEGVCIIIFSFLNEVAPADKEALVKGLTAVLTDVSAGRAQLQLQMLSTLYNFLPSGTELGFTVFQSMLDLAASTGQLDGMRSRVEAVTSSDTFPEEHTRSLLLSAADAFESISNGDAAQTFLINFLRRFEVASGAELASAKPQAIRAAIGYIKAPVVSQQSNLIDLRAVKQLAEDPKDKTLYDLLHIFAFERLESYNDFYAANRAYVDSIGLDHEQSVHTMRLLSLCSLAAEGETLPYSAIQETLQIPAEDVERWLVQGISLGLISGRMDQLNQHMLVSKWTQRVFGPDQWRHLQSKLGQWEERVQSLVDSIAAARA